MEIDTAAYRLAELGHVTRLAVFRHLMRCGPEGCRVGDLQQMLDVPASTLSHHLGRLIDAGLVSQIREGRVLRCKPVFSALDEILGFLTDER